jgi:hypothetical protein
VRDGGARLGRRSSVAVMAAKNWVAEELRWEVEGGDIYSAGLTEAGGVGCPSRLILSMAGAFVAHLGKHINREGRLCCPSQ